jgi:hypothetical protein
MLVQVPTTRQPVLERSSARARSGVGFLLAAPTQHPRPGRGRRCGCSGRSVGGHELSPARLAGEGSSHRLPPRYGRRLRRPTSWKLPMSGSAWNVLRSVRREPGFGEAIDWCATIGPRQRWDVSWSELRPEQLQCTPRWSELGRDRQLGTRPSIRRALRRNQASRGRSSQGAARSSAFHVERRSTTSDVGTSTSLGARAGVLGPEAAISPEPGTSRP